MTDSPRSSEPCQLQALVACLMRQAAAMERLADLIPQLIAQNQMLIQVLADRDEAEQPETYLDGTPVTQ